MLHFYLIRGLIRESRHWGSFPSLLAQAYPGCRITLMDIPGAGTQHHVDSPTQVATMVKFMRTQYLEAHTPEERPVLIVISLGGMIAAQWLHDYPADFSAAVMINTSFGSLSPVYHRMRPAAALQLLRTTVFHHRNREARILQLVSNHTERYDAGLALWQSIAADRPVHSANAVRQLLAAARFKLQKWTPSQSILLLASTTDRLVSVACSRAIATAWNVPLREHPSGGHDLSIDAPEWLVKQIQMFIS